MPDPGSFLAGLTVLDLCQTVAGGYCARLMAGLGAEVVKVEPPSGSRMRHVGPFASAGSDAGDESHPGQSIPFLYFEQGKKSVAIDWTSPQGSGLVRRLAAHSDAVIEDSRPGSLASLGLDFDCLAEVRPDIVLTSVTGFGQSGPYARYEGEEIVYYAFSGLMSLTGDPGAEPLMVGAPAAQLNAGQTAFTATLAALWRDDGQPRHIDISVTDCATALLDFQFGFLTGRGYLATRIGNANDKGHPWGVFPCKDGYAAVVAGPADRWPALAELFEEPRLLDPRFATSQGRINCRDEVDSLLLPWLVQHEKKEIFEAGQAAGLAFGYVRDAGELLDCPQMNARSVFSEVDHPLAGRMRYFNAPFFLGPGEWSTARAPLLGEHTDLVLREKLGLPAIQLAELRSRGVIG